VEQSTFLKIPFPSENEDPFWDGYLAQIEAQDALAFQAKIQSNIFVGGGGTITFTPGTSTLNWTSDFIIPVFHYGKKITISFGPDNLNRQAIIPDGYAIVVEIPYSMTDNVVGQMRLLAQLTPANHQQCVIGWRLGNKVYFRGMSPVGT
jgi:hypothetical protein